MLGPQLDPEVLSEIRALEAAGKFTDPRYGELVTTHYYPKHVLRMPLEQWPEPINRTFAHMNGDVYLAMQGPSEFGVVGHAILKDWDVKARLSELSVPTLMIGAAFDTMDPDHMKWMATEVQNGEYLHCPQGSHLSMYDDQEVYFEGLINYINKINSQ